MANADILNFGNAKLDTLYNETDSRDAVFAYLDSVIENYKTVNPEIPEATKNDLKIIRDQIEWLSVPSGKEYDPGVKPMNPKQHIRRFPNPGWGQKAGGQGEAEKRSKFTVLADEKKRQTWSFSEDDVKRRYWNQYDLLGLFFSKMGPAPGGGAVATQQNFYLPLTAVYGKFCHWIGGKQWPSMAAGTNPQQPENRAAKGGDKPKPVRNNLKGVGTPSQCYQCTWRPDTGVFFLGASLAGYDATGAGTWEAEVRKTRWDLLTGFWEFPGDWGSFEKRNSPKVQWDLKSPTLFGNCGETYPFLELLNDRVSDIEVRANTHGLALNAKFADEPLYIARKFDGSLMPPCLNCQQLLRYAGICHVFSYMQDSTMKAKLIPIAIPLPNH